MPDAVTHLLSARLAAPLMRPDRRAVFYLGVLWPDILAKTMTHVLDAPPGTEIASHSLVGLIIASAAAALLFHASERVAVFGLLMAGSALHLAGDVVKDFGVFSGLRILFPIWNHGVSLGWMRSEDWALVMPLSAAVIGAMELIVWRRRVKRG